MGCNRGNIDLRIQSVWEGESGMAWKGAGGKSAEGLCLHHI